MAFDGRIIITFEIGISTSPDSFLKTSNGTRTDLASYSCTADLSDLGEHASVWTACTLPMNTVWDLLDVLAASHQHPGYFWTGAS